MSTLYGSNATKSLVTVPSEKTAPGESDGRLRVIYDSYALGGVALVTGDVIRMGALLPSGSKVHDVKMIFPDLDAGAGARLDLGWLASADAAEAADTDGYGDSINVEAAGVYSMFTSQSTRPGQNKTFSGSVQTAITVEAQGGTPATTGTIYLVVEYSRD